MTPEIALMFGTILGWGLAPIIVYGAAAICYRIYYGKREPDPPKSPWMKLAEDPRFNPKTMCLETHYGPIKYAQALALYTKYGRVS